MRASAGDTWRARCDFFGRGCLGGLRVGLYEHSAAGREHMRAALAALGAEVVPLGRSDSFVPIDTEAIPPDQAERIRGWVAEHRLAALVSTDGDGDRPLVADETGQVLRGDALGALAGRLLGADAVAAPLNASTALEASGWFARVLRTRIGSPHVIEGMARLKAEGARLVVGYEANGGFLLGGTAVSPEGRRLEPLPTRDAMVPTLAILAAMARQRRPLSELAGELPARATDSGRLAGGRRRGGGARSSTGWRRIRGGPHGAPLPARGRAISWRPIRSTGCGCGSARARSCTCALSGNAPELRCYTEAATAGARGGAAGRGSRARGADARVASGTAR